jgi:hypothetical protein
MSAKQVATEAANPKAGGAHRTARHSEELKISCLKFARAKINAALI